MPGLEVYNDSGTVLFNTFAKNACMFAKGTHLVTTGSSGSPIGTRSILTVTSASFPMVAFRPQGSETMCVYQVTSSGTSYSFYIMCSGTSAAAIDWWGFNFSLQSASGVGLEVYDAAGTLNYSSGAYPLRIVSAQVAGSSYALIPGGISGTAQWDPYPPLGHYLRKSHFDGVSNAGSSQVRIINFIADQDSVSTTVASPTITYGPQNFIIADVTNY